MRKLSLIILLLIFIAAMANLSTDSPHGKDFTVPCSQCHSAKGWFLDKEIYSFNHSATEFPLTGLHQETDCRLCHTSLVFSEAHTECVECHTDMHNQTVGPACDRCHTTDSWIVNNITEIHQMSRFPLVGPHYLSDCSGCHPSASLLRWEPQGVECVDCHMDDYQATTSPNHVEGNYSTDCAECHLISSFTWTGAGVNHEFFPLTLGHAIGDCQQCHTGGSYSGLSPECSACHLPDYNQTVNPSHTALSLPVDCSTCHTTNPGWKPGTFSIHNDYYVLQGAHAAIAVNCDACHNGNYNSTPNTCVGCHLTEYNQTNNPPHASAQFPTDCEICHTQTVWVPSTFDHDNLYFPIYSGKHQGEWNTCSECHTNSANYTVFSCIDCHEHNQPDMDDEHNEVPGYTYNSIACLNCHPDGSGGKLRSPSFIKKHE